MEGFLTVLFIVIAIIAAVITLVSLFLCAIDDCSGWVPLVSFVIGLISFIWLIYGYHRLSKEPWTYEPEPYCVEQLVALNDNNLTNGHIYAKSGYINADLYYQYIKRVGNGGFQASKVKASIATVYYDDNNFRVEWYRKTKSWLYLTDSDSYVKIYIPEGSLSNEYIVDLE